MSFNYVFVRLLNVENSLWSISRMFPESIFYN